MSELQELLNRHGLTVSNERWKVQLSYEGCYAKDKQLHQEADDIEIILSESIELTSVARFICTDDRGESKSCFISGIQGGAYLYTEEESKGKTVSLQGDELIMSLGRSLVMFDLHNMQLQWQLIPDLFHLFEFYDLKEDLLVRGELETFRIDRKGNIVWSYGGRDIWVNIDGKSVVRFEGDKIILTDFNSDEYVIDYEGNTLAGSA